LTVTLKAFGFARPTLDMKAISIGFGREVTSHLEAALQREWLVTNGIGGYASSTVAMANTRRYHGLLVAAIHPPLGRTLLVSKLEATARLEMDLYPLTTNEYVDGTINPHGYHNLESFRLEGTIPVFTWAVADNLLEQRVWMAYGQNTTYVTYTLVRASRPIALEIIPLCTYREARDTIDIRGWMPTVRSARGGLRVDAHYEAVPYWLHANRGTFVPGVVRHWSIRHRADSYQGLEDREHLFAIGRLDAKLSEGETLGLVLTMERDADTDLRAAYQAEMRRQAELLAASGLDDEPSWVRHLALAADQFIAKRSIWIGETTTPASAAEVDGKTIIAGYPWFGDWGRDAMIALPGLTLATGRPEIAAAILRTFTRFVDQGMLPNRFTDGFGEPEPPDYGTADAALWFIRALQQYTARTGDIGLLMELYPTLVAILEWHTQGTRYGLGMDESDGLLRTGEAPVGLTWMNAQTSDRIITPRAGKPVEINALWHNALSTMGDFAAALEKSDDTARWRNIANRVTESFEARFWYEEGGYLYDVVDGPKGDDPTLRPNQILAVSLPHSPLRNEEKARAIVDTIGRYLQTSYGLRTLSPHDPSFVHRFGGGQAARANAYHQGTVWPWLIGPFVAAHLRVYGDRAKARSFLHPFADHLVNHGVGTISEVFDGNPPYTPRGCIASAWSVAQVLSGWLTCSS
jgi:predicted glycogen debranching enzyme